MTDSREERVLVHVCDPEGRVHGIGFMISRWYAVTCAHVVNAALPQRSLDARNQPNLEARVRLSFPQLGIPDALDAVVVEWHAPKPFEEATGCLVDDVAVLWLTADTPADLAPPPGNTPLVAGRRVRCHGCPQGPPGTYTWGRVSGHLKGNWVEVHHGNDSRVGYPIQRGFSGSPAFDGETSEIVGMVVAADRDPARGLSYLIPCDLLKELDSWRHPDRPPPQLPFLVEPYRGLATFREEDARFFFGRAAFVRQLVQRITNEPVTLVAGASGSGKSSLVFAGLIPRLREEKSWAIATFRPGETPLHSFAAALGIWGMAVGDSDGHPDEIAKQLRENPGQIHRLTSKAMASLKGNGIRQLLLYADQLEELFTLCRDSDERSAFIDVISAMATPPSRAHVAFLATLRSNFLGAVQSEPRLSQAFRISADDEEVR